MAFLIPNEAERVYLQSILPNIYVWLYQNDHTPTAGDTLGNYTLVNSHGIGPIINPFRGPASTAGGKAELTTVDLVWIKAASGYQEIYGYFLANPFHTRLYGAERFADPIILNDVGEVVEFAIKATLQSVG